MAVHDPDDPPEQEEAAALFKSVPATHRFCVPDTWLSWYQVYPSWVRIPPWILKQSPVLRTAPTDADRLADVRAFTLVPATHTHSPVVTCCPVMFADTPARKSIKMQSAVSIFFTVPRNDVLNLIYVHLIYIGLCDYLS